MFARLTMTVAIAAAACGGAAMTGAAAAQSLTHGIADEPAPPWRAEDWINLPKDTWDLEVEHYRDKIVYLLFFQAACPGCHDRALPTLKRLIDHYEGVEDVAFVAIQTTIEGLDVNTPRGARATAEKFELEIPVGHTGGHAGPSPLVRRYNTPGTPWVVIIDQEGIVRFNDFFAPHAYSVPFIDRLRAEASPSGRPVITTLPVERGGQQLVGTKLPKLDFDRRIAGKTPEPDVPVKATLYRWWTDGCSYCKSSLPAVNHLRNRYAERGLRVVGVFHPKPPLAAGETTPDDVVVENARYLGYDGVIAVDEDWSALDQVWPADHDRRATSVSLLVDAEGVIRFVHPGPVFFPSRDDTYARENADYRLIEKAIRAVLGPAEPASQDNKGTPR